MSRFPGWTKEAVEALTNHSVDMNEVKQIKGIRELIRISTPDYVGIICNALNILGIKYQREYRFLHDRRFRFDIAIPEHKIAIEFEGGIYSGGRHNRGKGYANDLKKYNLAVMNGWKLLRFTADDARTINWEYRVAEGIKKFIQQEPDLFI